MPQLHSLLSIAGSDPMGGAGIQADIRAGNLMSLHVMTALTTITAQNSHGLKESQAVSPEMLRAQLESIIEDATPDAIKIGMLGSPENLNVTADFLDSIPSEIPIVVDPVLYVSSQQPSLLKFELDSLELRKGYLRKIFPRATVITPNLDELKMLSGSREINHNTLAWLNANAAVIKGGHSEGTELTDYLLQIGKPTLKFCHSRVDHFNLHGTGCTFSTLLASNLALGESLEDAFEHAGQRMFQIIRQSNYYSLGTSNYGPLDVLDNYTIKEEI